VAKYLSILDQTYVNFLLPSYHTNLANELKKSRKTYLYDLGIRNMILKDFSPPESREDRGVIYESLVFLTLLPLLLPNMELRFWRTKKQEEVDLVLLVDRRPYPIEVKAGWGVHAPPPGILAFTRRYPRTRATFTVSKNSREPLRAESITHHFVSFDEVAEIFEKLR